MSETTYLWHVDDRVPPTDPADGAIRGQRDTIHVAGDDDAAVVEQSVEQSVDQSLAQVGRGAVCVGTKDVVTATLGVGFRTRWQSDRRPGCLVLPGGIPVESGG